MTKTPVHGRLRHAAMFYRGSAEYRAGIGAFLRAALDRGEPAIAAVPGERVGVLRSEMAADARRAVFLDMTELGRNPAEIIPAIGSFAGSHRGERLNYVGETAWAGRSTAELREAARHEALINLALADTHANILCPYDARALPAGVLADAERTHPVVVRGGKGLPSTAYLGSGRFPASCEEPLPPPPPGAVVLAYRTDLRPLRALAGRAAADAGLPDIRVSDLVLAVSEIAANTLRHTTGGGVALVWLAGGELLCEIRDNGWITDPLAGRRHPAAGQSGGQGLWLVNQVCDLVEMRTGPAGTVTRLHMAGVPSSRGLPAPALTEPGLTEFPGR